MTVGAELVDMRRGFSKTLTWLQQHAERYLHNCSICTAIQSTRR